MLAVGRSAAALTRAGGSAAARGGYLAISSFFATKQARERCLPSPWQCRSRRYVFIFKKYCRGNSEPKGNCKMVLRSHVWGVGLVRVWGPTAQCTAINAGRVVRVLYVRGYGTRYAGCSTRRLCDRECLQNTGAKTEYQRLVACLRAGRRDCNRLAANGAPTAAPTGAF